MYLRYMETILNYKRDPLSAVKGPLIRQILILGHMMFCVAPVGFRSRVVKGLRCFDVESFALRLTNSRE